MARCLACASDVDGQKDCGVCGESQGSARFVTYVGLSVMDKCPKCGNPLQIPGPHLDLLCDHCLETSEAKPKYWDIIPSALEYSSESPGKASGWSQNFRTDIDCMITAPKCPSCKTLLPAARIAAGTDGDTLCPSCGEDINTYPAPEWLKKVCPNVEQIFGAEKSGQIETDSSKVKPITFLCPDCNGNLKITAKEARVITCQYCDSDCYLPDGLWRRLHPVRTRSWWYVRLRDTAGQNRAEKNAAANERRQAEQFSRYEDIVREISGLRGSDPNADELKTWLSVTSAQERDSALEAIGEALKSNWAIEPTAKAVIRLRSILSDDKRERMLLGKLEVLIAEQRGDVAIALLTSIKVS